MAKAKIKSRSKAKQKKASFFSGKGFWVKLFVVISLPLLLFLIYLDAVIQSKFEGRKWSVPATVYARPLVLFKDAKVSQQQVIYELQQLGYHHEPVVKQPGQYRVDEEELEVYSRPFDFWDGSSIARHIALVFKQGEIIKLTSYNDEDDKTLRLEPLKIGGIYPSHNEDRLLVKLEESPRYFVDVITTVEDRDFFKHYGISLTGIMRAVLVNVGSGKLAQGGSTLTQQLIKNFFLTSERTLRRKLVELVMALLLEFHYEKEEILEAYLNEIYMGQQGHRAVHGFGLASRYYFGLPFSQLSLHQTALLVALVKGPSFYDPRRHPERALKRRDLVLNMMFEQEKISQRTLIEALAKPLGVSDKAANYGEFYPGFMDLVRRQLQRDYREQDLTSEGLNIYTTLDPYRQKQAESALSHFLDTLNDANSSEGKKREGAIVVTSPVDGSVQVLLAGRNARFDGFNRVLDAKRPIGSLIKPAIYLAALEQGYTLGSSIDDSAYSYRLESGSLWQPENYDHQSHGLVPLYRALAKSYNQSTVRLGMDVGLDSVANTLRALGLNRKIKPYPSMLLGAIELSPLEVAILYQTIASNGYYRPAHAITAVQSSAGEAIARYPLVSERRFDPQVAYLMQFALRKGVIEGTARSLELPEHIAVAGKTGTTDDYRDSWFAGFSANQLAVVWIGRDDNRPVGLTGATGALKVWNDLMTKLPLESLSDELPEGVEMVWVSADGERQSRKGCKGALFIPMRSVMLPDQVSNCGKRGGVKRRVKRWFDSWFR